MLETHCYFGVRRDGLYEDLGFERVVSYEELLVRRSY